MQTVCGCLAPMMLHYCNRAVHAMRFAEQRGIPRAPRRCLWVHDRVCRVAYLPSRLLVLLPVTAGILVVLSQVLHS